MYVVYVDLELDKIPELDCSHYMPYRAKIVVKHGINPAAQPDLPACHIQKLSGRILMSTIGAMERKM